MQIHSNDLSGGALVWVMCQALGYEPEWSRWGVRYRHPSDARWVIPNFTHQDQLHELMDRHWIGVERPNNQQNVPFWRATADAKMSEEQRQSGAVARVVSATSTKLNVAVCLAIIKANLGDVVEAPFHWNGKSWMPDAELLAKAKA